MRAYVAIVAAIVLALVAPVGAQVCNLKVVTDASPDYADMASLIHSITSKWATPEEKCWAIFYWHHINRRQQGPMWLHGMELTDPIRQWNDYGYTMCSTICGINCAVFSAMGYPVRHWEIQAHTVPEAFWGGRWRMYDDSMSCLYTLCDGVTLAGTEDIGKTQACAASGGKAEFAHIANYHCLNATGPKGFLTGADCPRELKQEGICFNPNKIRNQDDLWWDAGHRFILNLYPGESYTRHYARLGNDPTYYTPNPHRKNGDPDYTKFYKIGGNGVRTFVPALTPGELAKVVWSMSDVQAIAAGGIQPTTAGAPGEVVFKVEGANVITSMNIKAAFALATADDSARILIAPAAATRDDRWFEVWKSAGAGEQAADVKLIEQVSGEYDILVKVELTGKAAATNATLKTVSFRTITQVNAKALPRLNLGRNVIYVGAGDPTESVVLWPELQAGKYKPCSVDEQNIACEAEHPQVAACIHPAKPGEDAWVTFRLDAPRDIARVTYGGRLWNKAPQSRIDFLHSFDGGKTWAKSYTFGEVTPPKDDMGQRPYDVIHYETVSTVPPGTKSVLFRYLMTSSDTTPKGCGLITVRMEADYRPADAAFKPLEVTLEWKERQEDYSLRLRSHTQLIDRVPFTYVINTAGADHPKMASLRINAKGAEGNQLYGYSDGINVGGSKFVSFKAVYGRNFALDKKYELSVPSGTNWNAGDKADTHKLTDGIAFCAYGGGIAYSHGIYWNHPKDATITVDLEKPETVGAFRINLHGYPWDDAMAGEFSEKVEVLTSVDGKEFTSRGFFNTNLRWKDLPADFMAPDTERFEGHTFDLAIPAPVTARYVQYKVSSNRGTGITEVEALSGITRIPFDYRIALPLDAPPPAN